MVEKATKRTGVVSTRDGAVSVNMEKINKAKAEAQKLRACEKISVNIDLL